MERALIAGDAETGVSVIRLVHELDAGPIAAQERFPIAAGDDAGVVYARAAEVAARLLDEVLAEDPGASTSRSARSTYAAKISTLAIVDSTSSFPPAELVNRVRALSPHIGARAKLHGPGVTVWRAVVAADGSFEPLEVQPGGGGDGLRRMAARAAAVSPARVAAFDVLLRVFEQGAYADRALRTSFGEARRA